MTAKIDEATKGVLAAIDMGSPDGDRTAEVSASYRGETMIIEGIRIVEPTRRPRTIIHVSSLAERKAQAKERHRLEMNDRRMRQVARDFGVSP